MAADPHKDELTGIDTTGHEWDGIRELNNPLPKWWLYIFYATCIWAFGYWVAYPAWPYISGYTEGVLGYSSRAVHEEDIAAAADAQKTYLDRIGAATPAEIAADSELLDFALAGGRSAYAVNCSQCHGSGAAGAIGYPNLNDDAWIWGGTLDDIYHSINHGIRNETDPDARYSEMPAFGADGILDRQQVNDVVDYVLTLSGAAEATPASQRGAAIYAENCAACHGEKGEGMAELGAPNLSDRIWLYGGDRSSVYQTVWNSRYGVMPAWGQILDDATIKQLAVYIHSLGGGQ